MTAAIAAVYLRHRSALSCYRLIAVHISRAAFLLCLLLIYYYYVYLLRGYVSVG